MDLAPPLHLGRLRASVLRLDRMGLKEQLTRGLWLTQPRGRKGYGVRGKPAVAEASVTLQQHEVRRVFSRGSCPWIMGPRPWRAAPAPGRGGVESDLCSHTGFLVAAAAALVSHAVSGVHADSRSSHRLWSSFRRCSESPLLARQETMVSCLLGSSRLFPGCPPS